MDKEIQKLCDEIIESQNKEIGKLPKPIREKCSWWKGKPHCWHHLGGHSYTKHNGDLGWSDVRKCCKCGNVGTYFNSGMLP